MGLVSANRKLFDHNAGAATGRSWIKQPDLGLVTKNRKVLENATLAASSSSSSSSSPTLSAAALVAAALSTAASSPSSSSTSSSFSQPSAHYRWKSNQEKTPSPLKSNIINQQNQQQQQLKEQTKNNNNMDIVQRSMPPLRQPNKHQRDKSQEQTNDEKIDSLLSFLDKPVIVPRSMKRRGG